jgi:hypothetical protein
MLAELGGEPALRGVLSGSVEACTDRWSAEDCLHRLGIYLRGQPVQPSPAEITALEVQGPFVTGPGELAFVDLRRGAGDGDASRTPSDGVLLVRDSVVVFAGGKESGRASLAALIAASEATRVLPPRMVPLVGPGGTSVADLAVQHIDIWRADGRTPEVLRLAGAIVWRP